MSLNLELSFLLAVLVFVSGKPIKKDESTNLYTKEVLFLENKPAMLDCIGQEYIKARVLGYKWFKDGVLLPTVNTKDHHYEMSTNPDSTLLTLKPVVQNEGTYRCLTETSDGIVSSQKYNVKRAYIEIPKGITTNITPIRGRPFKLDCPIPNGHPRPTVNWYKGATPEHDVLDKRILTSPDGSLCFSNATDADITGNDVMYTCMASSPALARPEAVARVQILKLEEDNSLNKGELTEQYVSKDLVGLVGENTAIYCIYGGTPLAHPDWFKDGADVNGRPGDRITRHNRSAGRRLLIKDTRREDEGKYTCVVDNEVGAKETHTVRLAVEEKPTLLKKPERQISVEEGKDLFIPCAVRGTPSPKITWTYNAKPLPESDRLVVNQEGLMIKNIQKSDKGYYGCEAVNKHGEMYSETAVTFE